LGVSVQKKNVIANEIAGFDGLNYFVLVILSKLAAKCVSGV
jgi:hypothetical protein